MDKGIRPYCNAKFVELNNLRNRGELTNTQFRKSVIACVMENFGTTLASAATHYNHAFKTVKELNSELVSGLGRADDKKGGRKPKAKVVAAAPASILGNVLLARRGNEGDEVVAEATPAVQTYTVMRAKTGAVIATGLVLADAETMCARAASAKKAKLFFA